MKKLIKSYSFWTALAGSMGVLAVALGNAFGVSIASESVEQIIMAICGVLIVFGIVPKPKSKTQSNENNTENAEAVAENAPSECDGEESKSSKQNENVKK